MHPVDVLKYGHATVLTTLEPFPDREWYTSGACGYWSVKDLIAHIGSFELVLAEVLNNLLDSSRPKPLLDAFIHERIQFNDVQVDARKDLNMQQVRDEYINAYEDVMVAAEKIPSAIWQQSGTLPWYGMEYDLEDLVVYMYYAHKREHCGQIAVFSDRFK